MRRILVALTLLSVAGGGGYPATAQSSDARDVVVAKVPSSVRQAEGFDPAQSVGLFVGIRDFEDEKFLQVPYAVDDAVDLAHLFALELELIKPSKMVLALAGEPQKAVSKARLETLIQGGATREPATQTDVLRLLDRQRRASGPKGLFVAAFATHGFSEEGSDFLVAADSLRSFIQSTGVVLNQAFDVVAKANAPRRLVLLDACRERFTSGRRGTGGSEMGQTFHDAIAGAQGQVVLSGATLGGYSYDDRARLNGVFTAAVLDGLRGGAATDSRSLITVRTLADYVNDRVLAWVRDHRPEDAALSQGISRRLEGAVAEMPLAADVGRLRAAANYQTRRDAALVLLRQNLEPPLTGAIYDQMRVFLGPASPSPKRLELIAEIEALDGSPRMRRALAYYWSTRISVLVPTRPPELPAGSLKIASERSGMTDPNKAGPEGDAAAQRHTELELLKKLLTTSKSRKDLVGAFDTAQRLADQYPQHVESQFLAAEIAYRLARWNDAVKYFERSGDLNLMQPERLFYYSVSLYEAGDRATAARLFESCVQKLEPTDFVRNYAAKIMGVAQREAINAELGSLKDPVLGIDFVYIEPGSFQMGSPITEKGRVDNETLHTVTLTRGFWMGATEVTQGQWQKLMGNNPSRRKSCGAECPVENVNWYEALHFANELSRRSKLGECYELSGDNGKKAGEGREYQAVRFKGLDCEGYRLPAEAEWEMAARAGTSARYAGTDDPKKACAYGNVSNLTTARTASPFECEDGYEHLAPVASFRPNGFGLSDMTGNVWEWVWDWYGAYQGDARDPLGSASGQYRVIRGGSFAVNPQFTRVAFRFNDVPSYRNSYRGFRVARSLP